jgi:hypothetical protein
MYQEGQHKKYSQKDSDESDPRSRQVSAEFLLQQGLTLASSLEEQAQTNPWGDWDFVMQTAKGTTITVETERKKGWQTNDGRFLITSPKCPEGRIYPTVDVSGRKWKSKAHLFIMVNNYYDSLCMTEMQNVLNAPIRGKDTSVGTKGEGFFKVPNHLFQFFVLRNGVWTKVNG